MSLTISRNPNLSVPTQNINFANSVQNQFKNAWWTGLSPDQCPGYDDSNKCLRALPLLNFDICNREDVLAYFNNTWTLTELLFSGLKTEEAFWRPPYHQLRHPLMFYYGHTAVVFVNKLRLAGLVKNPINPYLEKILEIGVDEMSWDDMSKNEMSWPKVSEVHAYRKEIYSLIKNIILTHSDFDHLQKYKNDYRKSPVWAVFMGFEHEKIHFETSSVLIRELPIELVEKPQFWPPLFSTNPQIDSLTTDSQSNKSDVTNPWIKFDSQNISLGKKSSSPSFGWDNEYGQREVMTKPFQITQNLISNLEFYQFVKSNDYTKDTYWQPEGLHWRKFRNTRRPTFWMSVGPEGLHDYKLRTIFEIIEMPWDWPAEVNFHEAIAFTQWKQEKDQSSLKYRLLTEAEHKQLSDQFYPHDIVLQSSHFKNSEQSQLFMQSKKGSNLNFYWSSPQAVTYQSVQANEPRDIFGNVWQWCEDQFNPLDNFSTHPLYEDFSTPCFDGKHQMILGGSFISCGHEASRWARFHFRPHFYQHAGFRMAASLDGSVDNGSFKFNSTREYVHQTRANILDQMQQPDWWKKTQQPLNSQQSEFENILEISKRFIQDFHNKFSSFSPSGNAYDSYDDHLKKDFKVTYQTTKNFPFNPSSFEGLMKLLFHDALLEAQHPGHPGFAGYVAGGGNFYSSIAQLIALEMNPYSAHYHMAPTLVTLEAEAIQWLVNMVGYDSNQGHGYFTSGGSLANQNALALARNHILKNKDLDKACFYMNQQGHHCISKALHYLGFLPSQLRLIANDDLSLKINTQLLELQIQADLQAGLKPVAIIGTAGSTNTGTVDSLLELSQLAQKYNLWYHVDGAYGASFLLTEHGKKIMEGISLADSIALDPHKGMSLPYGTGCLLVKNKKTLNWTHSADSSYMPPRLSENDNPLAVDYAEITPELSRDYRGLRFWLPIKILGIGPFQLNLEEKLKLTAYVEAELASIQGISIRKKSDLSIISFSVKSAELPNQYNELTKKLMQKINRDQKFFLTGCTVQNQFLIRICLLGTRFNFEMAQKLIQSIKEKMND